MYLCTTLVCSFRVRSSTSPVLGLGLAFDSDDGIIVIWHITAPTTGLGRPLKVYGTPDTGVESGHFGNLDVNTLKVINRVPLRSLSCVRGVKMTCVYYDGLLCTKTRYILFTRCVCSRYVVRSDELILIL